MDPARMLTESLNSGPELENRSGFGHQHQVRRKNSQASQPARSSPALRDQSWYNHFPVL
jgi:hypothetical protein